MKFISVGCSVAVEAHISVPWQVGGVHGTEVVKKDPTAQLAATRVELLTLVLTARWQNLEALLETCRKIEP